MVSRSNDIIVLAPPKTASNSLYKCLEDSGVEFDRLPFNKGNVKQHQTLSELCNTFDVLDVNIVDFKIIQIVRNPLDRLVSSFLHHNRMVSKPIEFDNLIEDLVELKPLLPNNIDEFYDHMYEPHWVLKMEGKPHWGGIRLWYEQNWYNDKFANVKTFKLEDLQKDVKPLADYLNLDIKEFPIENKHNTEDYLSYYTNEQIEIVKDLYKRDFKLFDYEL